MINWTLTLCVLALTLPPSVAYAVGLLMQLRNERAKQVSEQHEKVIEMHEIALDQARDRLAELEQLTREQQKEISKLADREY